MTDDHRLDHRLDHLDHALDHVVLHVRDALATDARVGELGLEVTHVGDTVVVRGAITTAARRAGVAAVAEEVLRAHGCDLHVRDETELASTAAPTAAPEQL